MLKNKRGRTVLAVFFVHLRSILCSPHYYVLWVWTSGCNQPAYFLCGFLLLYLVWSTSLTLAYWQEEKESSFFFLFQFLSLYGGVMGCSLLTGRLQLLWGSLLSMQHSLQVLVNVLPHPLTSRNGKGTPIVSSLGCCNIRYSFPKSCPHF